MIIRKAELSLGTLVTGVLLCACATTENLVSAPTVQLKSVQLTDLDLAGQTFLLGFDIANPNPFPLPVASIEYGVALDGHRFASGETAGAFTVPAGSGSEFAIKVNLDLMRTAPTLFWTVRDAARGEVPYELEGELGVDIPLIKPVTFRSAGQIRLNQAGY
jgi:LEA14-like dessication related protein